MRDVGTAYNTPMNDVKSSLFVTVCKYSVFKLWCHGLARNAVCAALVLLGLLQSCVHAQTATSDAQAPESYTVELADNIPQQALTADLLADLLMLNLALFDNQADMGLAHARAAASASNDPRLAKAAVVLAVQNKDYVLGLEMAEFWLQLQPEADDAFDLLILCLVNQSEVDQALARLARRGVEDDSASEEALNSVSKGALSESKGAISESEGALSEFEKGALSESKGALSAANIDTTIRALAGLVVQQDNRTAALSLMEQIQGSHPNSAQVHLSAAYVAGTFGEQALAAQLLDRALELKPGWESAALAKAELINASQSVENRIDFLDGYLKDFPDSIAMRTLLGAELARANDLDRAQQEIARVLERDGRNIQALSFAAMIAAQLGDTDTEQKYYRRVLDIEPTNEDALLRLAGRAERAAQYATAKKYYSRVSSQENFVSAQVRLAVIAAQEQQFDDALELLSALEPNSEDEFFMVAFTRHLILTDAERVDEALGNLSDSLMYLPDNAQLLYARALLSVQMGDLKLAEADFKRVLAQEPEHVEALNAYGYTLADQTDRYTEAKELIEQALALEPNAAHILDSYGWVMFRLGDYELAHEYLLKAASLSDEVEIEVHLGEVLWAMQKSDQAIEVWTSIKQQQPDNELLEATLQRLGVDLNENE